MVDYGSECVNNLAPYLCRGPPIKNQWSGDFPLRVPAVVGLEILERGRVVCIVSLWPYAIFRVRIIHLCRPWCLFGHCWVWHI